MEKDVGEGDGIAGETYCADRVPFYSCSGSSSVLSLADQEGGGLMAVVMVVVDQEGVCYLPTDDMACRGV